MKLLRDWWWPGYAFIFPLLVWPGNTSRSAAVMVHLYATVGFIVVGVLLEWAAHPQMRLTDARFLPTTLRKHPGLLLALAYGVWVIVAALFSVDPTVALTGSVSDHSDGAFGQLALVVVFALVYIRALADNHLFRRVGWAIVAVGAVLAVGGLIEVLLGRGLFYDVAAQILPQVTFPYRGHLAGMWVFAGGIAAGLWLYPFLFVIALGMGLTFNRASLLGLVGLLGWILLKAPKKGLVLLLVSALGLVGGWGVNHLRSSNMDSVGGPASTLSLETRSYGWRAALRGIVQRPVFGCGGGSFYQYWGGFLSDEELKGFFRAEYREEFVRREGMIFLLRNSDGKVHTQWFSIWKSHNHFIEIALLHGLVGLILYGGVLFFALQGLRNLEAIALGLLAYHIFLFFWFIPPETEGVLWLALGSAVAYSYSRASRPT